jgi:hypothetical protein
MTGRNRLCSNTRERPNHAVPGEFCNRESTDEESGCRGEVRIFARIAAWQNWDRRATNF